MIQEIEVPPPGADPFWSRSAARLGRRFAPSAGISVVEIVIAMMILAIALVPMIGLFTGGREQAHMSEHQIYAELLCARATEDCSTRHYGFLYRSAGNRGDFFRQGQDYGLERIDRDVDKLFVEFKEYEQNAWKGPRPIKSNLVISKVGTDPEGKGAGAGLMSIKINADWGDIRMLKDKESKYSLLRLRAKRDYGLRSCYRAGNEL